MKVKTELEKNVADLRIELAQVKERLAQEEAKNNQLKENIRAFNSSFDERLRVEHWDVARRQGMHAGRNMAGADEIYDALPYFYSDIFDLSFEVWGDLSKWNKTIQRGRLKSGSFAFYYFYDNQLVGVLAVNRPSEERTTGQALIKAHVKYSDVKKYLEDEDANLSELVDEELEEKMTQSQDKKYSFQQDIVPLFRQKDIDEMKDISGFDLSDYEDVKKWADSIYSRLADGSMPCDEPWSDEDLAKYKQWMDQGMPV